MERKYQDWQDCAMEETKRKVLKTIDKIIEDAGSELGLTDLEKLNYGWDILRDMANIRSLENPPAAPPAPENGGSASGAMALA